MTGLGYWIYSYQSHWDYEGITTNWSVVYRRDLPDCPPEVTTQELIVPGKRWEATREGVEDYAYLHMLRSLIDEASLPPDSSILQDAEDTLANWTETVLDFSDVDFASQAKVDIMEAIVALSSVIVTGTTAAGTARHDPFKACPDRPGWPES